MLFDSVLLLRNGQVDRLVDQGLEIGPAPVLSCIRNRFYGLLLHIMETPHLLVQDFGENSSAFSCTWKGNVHLQVEPACPQNCLVHQVQPVCCSHHHYPLNRRESVHLAQELVNRSSRLVTVSQMVHAAAQGIDFIHEDNTAFGALTSSCKKLPYSFGAHSHVHLLKL